MDDEKKRIIEEALRVVRGQAALEAWNLRRQRLEEAINMLEAWTDPTSGSRYDENTRRRLYNIHGIAPAIENLTEALRVVDAEIQALAEFAPKPKKKGKK